MTRETSKLPIPVLEKPHWRVNFRPEVYIGEAIPSLSQCFQIIEKNQVRLRGWYYPHLSNHADERTQGKNWVASWVTFRGHIEYWRFYQSTQFIHYFSVRESTEEGWRAKLQKQTASHLFHNSDIDWNTVPGFISITNFLYTVTEIIEFAARLCQAQVYKGNLDISIQISSIKGFMLTADEDRAWNVYCPAGEDMLDKIWTIDSGSLIADSPEYSLDIIAWFFERFGWLNPSKDVLRKDIDNYLKGRR